jgi:Bacterial alpha-L-rhamnosidase C-terminal domain/Bacterial alpha-L-rhamnosidase 6 hairpin glycosidase domain
VNDLRPSDYAYVRRTGTTVAYFNAGYVRALRQAAQLATWIGQRGRAAAWQARAERVGKAFGAAFWDESVGAFKDTSEGDVVHPQDGNAFAVLAGVASPEQSVSALDWVARKLWRPYGPAMADSNRWDRPAWGRNASQRVYPFITYFEVMARYSVGLDDSALELVRRVWGHMLRNGPSGTMWETIGPGGGPPVDPIEPSWSHGWSSGGAPALTRWVLGVSPLTPGFATVSVEPRLNGVGWARGRVPTPRGPIEVEWRKHGRTVRLVVTTPVAARLTLPVAGRATLNGKRIDPQAERTSVRDRAGVHTLVVVR